MEKALRKQLPGGAFDDVSSPRSNTMRAIRGWGNRSTELRLRFALVRAGISGWQLRPNGLPGRPDFLFADARLAVFVDGCFWHACPRCGHAPKTRSEYWNAKLRRNSDRDVLVTGALRNAGYAVLRFWEHELLGQMPEILRRIKTTLGRQALRS